MKKVLGIVSEVAKICLNILMGTLCFIKIDHDVAILPNDEGDIIQVDYYYSIYEKLFREDIQFLVYIALAVMAASVALSVVACIAKDNRKVRIASYVIFAVYTVFFIVLLFYTMQVLQYNY